MHVATVRQFQIAIIRTRGRKPLKSIANTGWTPKIGVATAVAERNSAAIGIIYIIACRSPGASYSRRINTPSVRVVPISGRAERRWHARGISAVHRAGEGKRVTPHSTSNNKIRDRTCRVRCIRVIGTAGSYVSIELARCSGWIVVAHLGKCAARQHTGRRDYADANFLKCSHGSSQLRLDTDCLR
jgi:hypothetical protein